jgi:4a-hydroxytetrahydrobiopterin dehydratase
MVGMATTPISNRLATLAVDGRCWHAYQTILRADWRLPDFAGAAAFVARIARIADELGHHPDVLLRWGQVTVVTTTHEAMGLTQADVDLANAITAVADEAGAQPVRPAPTGVVEIAIDALDRETIRPFWKAVLAYDDWHDELVDPAGRGPTVWFQQMDVSRPQRNRIHLDVLVAHDEALARIAAALDAGGHLVTAAFAPKWWVLADAEGNEACVCTWRGREPDDADADPADPGRLR